MSLWTVDDWGVIADRACWAMFSVTTVVVMLRTWCRLAYGGHGKRGFGLDDYITILCNIVLLITCVLVTIGSHYGLGKRMDDIQPPTAIPKALKWNVIISSVLIWVFSLPKFAIVAILKRILDYGTKTTILFWGLALTSQAAILATSVWWWKQCDPVEFGWNKNIPGGGKCADIKVLADLGYFTSAYSAFLDLFFALYPLPFIMRLNMKLKNRIAVSIALSLSSMAFIVSIYKLAIFGDIFKQLALNPTYPVPFLDILGVAEGCILIICASLPTLGPLVRATRGRLTSNSGNSSQPIPSENSASGRSWANLKGHQLGPTVDIERVSSHGRSSVDDIPLVSQGGHTGTIHKKTEFTFTEGS